MDFCGLAVRITESIKCISCINCIMCGVVCNHVGDSHNIRSDHQIQDISVIHEKIFVTMNSS